MPEDDFVAGNTCRPNDDRMLVDPGLCACCLKNIIENCSHGNIAQLQIEGCRFNLTGSSYVGIPKFNHKGHSLPLEVPFLYVQNGRLLPQIVDRLAQLHLIHVDHRDNN